MALGSRDADVGIGYVTLLLAWMNPIRKVEEATISSLKRDLGALNTHLTSNISRRPCCYFGRYFYDL
ncbi:hypothetical protein C4D60_Mb09t17790 [Musa balbisiana]|uniref:Uncharacterized protein n=1 Tax=Musa balbisiana TaxID=52838 RepID=A0A4S8IH92_MUSBA|nr:hypothetical protein C4D60_Mb09t17790 [Musa balbisiana]